MPIVLVFMAATPVAAGYISDARGSYDLAFSITGAITAIGMLCSFLMAPPIPKISGGTLCPSD
jgi:hypothetical protein